MRNIHHIIFFIAIICLMTSCKKESLLDGSTSIERSNALEKNIKTQLAGSKDGWILFVTTLGGNVKTEMPFILKFDTLSGAMTTTSIYGKEVPSFFNISATTGAPLLTFSTGSPLSAVYELGSTTITDYFFKVLTLSSDSITMQPFRKGTGSASEGGSILKMVKNTNPDWIKEWQRETISLYSRQDFFGIYLDAEFRLADGMILPPVKIAFINYGAGDQTYLKANYPTATNNKDVMPLNLAYFPATGGLGSVSFTGYNSLYFDVYASRAGAAIYGDNIKTLQGLFKTNYFFVRKINAESIDLFAIDKNGKEFITGKISY